jgi:DNA polymerase III epsilon subunit-like protein
MNDSQTIRLLLFIWIMSVAFSCVKGFRVTMRFPTCITRWASTESKKSYLNVPFSEKDDVKALGARWDKETKQWYIPDHTNPSQFAKWMKVYLQVPYSDRAEAKALGALWDATEQKWYTQSGNLPKFEKWATATSTTQLTDDLRSNGLSPADAVVILDVDTTGLPSVPQGKPIPEFTDLMAFDTCRLIQCSYALCNKHNFDLVKSGMFIIRSDGFPIENEQFHGISLEVSQTKGIPFVSAAKDLVQVMSQADFILSHNAAFDLGIFKSELFRYGLLNELNLVRSKTAICAMTVAAPVVGLLDKIGHPKNPTMKELVKCALNEEFPAVHNSIVDVDFLRRSLQSLVANKKLMIGAVSSTQK